ncbi:MAG: PAS domain S-box protein [Verrucomicrobia bacterium]|nr:PAS domain S-box protein [Verrucomicrobiota bacterium]
MSPETVSLTAVADPAGESAGSPWWRYLLEASEDAQLVCRRDGAVVEANRRARQLIGLGPEVVWPAYLLSSFLTSSTVTRLQGVLGGRSGRPETLAAVTLLCRGQLSLVADLRVTPLGEEHALVAVKDASQRWRMESHIQRLITAINSTTDVVYLTDALFKLTFVNTAFQQVTGHTIEEALGQKADFLRAPGVAGQADAYREAMSRGEDWRGELVNVRRDGTTYPVEAAISPIFDKHGAFLGVVALERDITAQKRLQGDLELERDYVQSIIDSVDAAIYTVDRQLRLRHVNRHAEQFPAGHGWLALKEAPQKGRSLLEYIPDEPRRDEVREVMERVLIEGRPHEIRAPLSEGAQWLVKVTPWQHDAEILGLNYVVVDQTRFCQLQAQLYQAQKMETIGALAAGVAHDFNNLLLAVRGNVTLLLLDEKLGGDTRRRLGQIDQAAARAAEITQQLLSFSRTSEEKEVVLDFNRLVREASQLARRTLKRGIELHLALTETPIKVRIDNTRANQLLLNLVVNAADAMPDGGAITVSNRLLALCEDKALQVGRPSGTQFLRCSVADTGTGIAPEVLPRIFDPFFTTKAKGKGTGLGLAIVHNIVARAGGFIDIDSRLGAGTTFHIHLPTVLGGLTEQPRHGRPSLVKGSGRVLVVDDLDFIVDFTRSFLQAAGYEVFVAGNADEALGVFEREGGRLDVLLTDYAMPGRNGVELIKEARARWPHLRCILASGYLEEEESRRLEQELRVHILNKPYNVREATDVVRRVIDQA